jgi:hypothetical protein
MIRAQSSAPPAGLEPAWDIAVVLEEIGVNATRVLPALNGMDPNGWVARGASETYVAQWQSAREQVKAIADAAKVQSKYPERLSGDLELFFRMEAVERMVGSIAEAARRYGSADAARQLESLYAEGGSNRERFRRYIVNLAAERERQFEVMDKEAQRCRATLMAPVPPRPNTTTGRKK